MADITELRTRFEAAGQAHVLRFYDTLDGEAQAALAGELAEVDLDVLARFHSRAMAACEETFSDPSASAPLHAIEAEDAVGKDQLDTWWAGGLDAVAAGEVAAVLLAGGQGTRLGSSQPKGCYDIGAPSGKSLFQLQAERIAKVQALAAAKAGKPAGSVVIPWYIMTSAPTDAPTQAFFTDNEWFGLAQDQIMFFQQGTLPCLTVDGKLILESAGKLARAPDGNGGIYEALDKRGVLADMEARGVKYVHTYCVDNCLAKVADPVFIGYCVAAGVGVGVKVIPKLEPAEKVGVLALRDGVTHVLEYSELPKELAEKRTDDGSLVYSAANIVNHFYTVDFLKATASTYLHDMVHHVAHKKIPHVSDDGSETIKPTSNTGIKLELFIFDVFPSAGDSLAVLQGARARDFSPLKNAPGTGSDCPETARMALAELHASWFVDAGGALSAQPSLDALFEIAPAVSYAGEGLEAFSGVAVDLPYVIDEADPTLNSA